MTDDASGRIQIDSDWKKEAQREKERLAEAEKAAEQAGPAQERGPAGAANVLDIINLLATNAAIGLGGYQAPDGQRIPPDLAMAKYHIDLLVVFGEKTKGNLSEDEKKVLDGVVHELRMAFVEIVQQVQAAATKPPTA